MKGNRQQILVVEDDTALSSMYRNSLRFAGFSVCVVGDAIAALWHIEQSPPDLIVLDLNLPGLRGDIVAQEVCARPDFQHIPVIVVTGSNARVVAEQATAILSKPCDPSRLVCTIERHLRSVA